MVHRVSDPHPRSMGRRDLSARVCPKKDKVLCRRFKIYQIFFKSLRPGTYVLALTLSYIRIKKNKAFSSFDSKNSNPLNTSQSGSPPIQSLRKWVISKTYFLKINNFAKWVSSKSITSRIGHIANQSLRIIAH